MLSLSSPSRRLAVVGLVVSALATSLAACAAAPGGEPTASASREAALYRASRICIVNESGSTLSNVAEYEMQRTGPSNPDPAGPLADGATWCTNGYNSFTDADGESVDASVQINFTSDPVDFVQFEVDNPGSGRPWLQDGYKQWNTVRRFTPGNPGQAWERDAVVPTTTFSVPHHAVHLRRADDSNNFIEWIVTVKP